MATSPSATPANSLPAGSTILIVDQTNGVVYSLTVYNDGSVTGQMPATISDILQVTLTDPSGNKATFTISQFVAADGTTAIGAGGGTVTGPGGTGIIIPAGAPTDIILDSTLALVGTGSNVLVVDLTNPYDPVSGGQITGSFGTRLALDPNGTLIAGNVSSATAPNSTVQTTTLQYNNKIQATQACVTGALEEVIKYAEGTSGTNGYGLLVYGTVLSVTGPIGDILAAPQPGSLVGQTGTPGDPIVLDPNSLTAFPNIAVQAGANVSHAFGAYQFLPRTWTQYGGGSDISISAQDDVVATAIQSLGALSAAMSGDFQDAIWDLNTTWASLPEAPYPQPTISWGQASSVYQNAFTYLPECQTANGSMSPP